MGCTNYYPTSPEHQPSTEEISERAQRSKWRAQLRAPPTNVSQNVADFLRYTLFAQVVIPQKLPIVPPSHAVPSNTPLNRFLNKFSSRKVLCSTNAIESLNARYRRAIRARGHFPTEQAAMKCLYLVTRSLDPTGTGSTRWTMRWKPVINALAITFSDRWPATETC